MTLPEPEALEEAIRREPCHPLDRRPGRAAGRPCGGTGWPPGRYAIAHRWKQASILAAAFRHDVPITVHPGIGYDIIANHPMFNGAAIGRAAQRDFAQFAAAVEGLDGGVVLSVGSAIMGPQVFEKSLSCVNNLRLQAGRPVVAGHTIYVVDLQDGGGWDWYAGEPPKTNPAYYLRFCKSYVAHGRPDALPAMRQPGLRSSPAASTRRAGVRKREKGKEEGKGEVTCSLSFPFSPSAFPLFPSAFPLFPSVFPLFPFFLRDR